MQGTINNFPLLLLDNFIFFLLKCSPSADLQVVAYSTGATLATASGATEKIVYEGTDVSCSTHHCGIAFPNLSVVFPMINA